MLQFSFRLSPSLGPSDFRSVRTLFGSWTKYFREKKAEPTFDFQTRLEFHFHFHSFSVPSELQKTFQKSFKNLPSILFAIHSTGPFLPSSSIPSERQKTFYNFWKKHFGPGSDFQTRLGFLLRSQFLLSSFWRQKSSTHFSRSFYVKNDLQNTHTGLSSPLRTGGQGSYPPRQSLGGCPLEVPLWRTPCQSVPSVHVLHSHTVPHSPRYLVQFTDRTIVIQRRRVTMP